MIEFRPHRFHDLTEAFQILTHVLELDSLLLIQELIKMQSLIMTLSPRPFNLTKRINKKVSAYCLDTPVEYRLMDKGQFAQLPDKLDVAQHFDLCNRTLLLFLRGKRAVLFVKDYNGKTLISITSRDGETFCNQSYDLSSYLQHFWHGSQTHLEAWKSEVS